MTPPSICPRRLVGLIPAAGRATRISPLPCSKEILPLGLQADASGGKVTPKAVSQYLLELMRAGGAREVFFIVRSGKGDIADYYGDGSRLGLNLGYLQMGEPWGPPFTLAQAAPFVADATVLVGFPDILIQPADAYARLLARQAATGADVVLGLFTARASDGLDIVDTTPDGRVTRVTPKEDKPPRQDGDRGWMLAVWGPRFTAFLTAETRRLATLAREGAFGPAPEWPVGALVAAGMAAGLAVDSVHFPDGRFLDVGTSAGLIAASRFPGVWNGEGPAP